MKRENIIAYVHDPSRLDQSSLKELEELLDAYPWFQTAHLLVAKNHHNIDSIQFHEVLRDSAAYVGDRTVLYHLIHRPAQKTGMAWMDETARGLSEKTEPREEPVLPMPGTEQDTGDQDEIVYPGAYTLDEVPVPSETSTIEEYTFTGWFEHFPSTPAGKPAQTEEEKLIDKFIHDSPVISPDRDLPQSAKDLSDSSTLDSDSFMTETLARIYENQGMIKKAILTYEKLSLKYPEKSTYFATQINRLKSQL